MWAHNICNQEIHINVIYDYRISKSDRFRTSYNTVLYRNIQPAVLADRKGSAAAGTLGNVFLWNSTLGPPPQQHVCHRLRRRHVWCTRI